MSFEEFFSDYENENNCSPEKYECYEAGAQSRQAEIDELQKNFNNALKTIEVQQKFLDDADGANKFLINRVDELQERINEALKYVSESPLKDVSRKAMLNFLDILKGETK